MLASAAQAAD
jgi:hypothetical protein